MMSFEALADLGMGFFRHRDRKPGTNRTLNSEQLFWMRFLTVYGLLEYKFLPPERVLIAYVVYASFGLAATSISGYIGAIKKLHSDNPGACRGIDFEKHTESFWNFKRVFQGITNTYGTTRTNVQEAFPAALIVLVVRTALAARTVEGDQFVAMFLLAIFAVRRLADLMAKNDVEFESIRHVCIWDIWIGPDHMIVRIKATKTRGLLEEPLMFPIARLPGNLLCPVTAMERHLSNLLKARRPARSEDPLFQQTFGGNFLGRALGKDRASADIRARVRAELGRDAPEFSGRSCRVTGATMLMRAGVSEWLVRWIGDWKESTHWGVYVRTPLPELLELTRKTGAALGKGAGFC